MENKIKASSFFAGAGGIDKGFESAGFSIVYANEYDKYAVETFEHNFDLKVDHRDIREVMASNIPESDIMLGGFPCFVKGTRILTENGYKNIQDIKTGDRVLTHTNSFKSVVTPMSRHKKGIYDLIIQGSPINQVTGEHPYYTRIMTRVWNNKKRRYERVWSEPTWVDVDDLKEKEHFIGSTINNLSTNGHNLTSEEAWLLGRYIADGYIRNGKRKDRVDSCNSIVVYSVGKTKLDEFKKHVSTYNLGVTEERTVFKVRVISKRMTELALLCGRGSNNKVFPPMLLNLPNDLLEQALNGYLSGDGSVNGDNYSATTVSKDLAYSLQQVVHKLYQTPCNLTLTKRPPTCVIEGRTVNQQDTWTVRFKKVAVKQNNAVCIDGMMWYPVRKKTYLPDWEGDVYNIEVEDDNSYVAHNMVVHNCQAFSIAGLREGFTDEKGRGDLFFEMERIFVEKNPSIIFLENVKNLVAHDNGNTFRVIIDRLESAGYHVKCQVLNAMHFGNVPQNRERIYIVAFKDKKQSQLFDFPKPVALTTTLRDVIDFENEQEERYYYTPEKNKFYDTLNEGMTKTDTIYQWRRAYVRENKSKVSPTLTANMGTGGHNVPLIRTDSGRIRKLTPKECFNLQGFPPEYAFPEKMSNTRLYKQAGNSVVVSVIQRIAENIMKVIEETNNNSIDTK